MSDSSSHANLSKRTETAIRLTLAGRKSVLSRLLFVGPAVIVSIAYIDPGNFAANIQAGAKYGYGLLGFVLLANLLAMLFQALSAKLGIVTSRNLAELCRMRYPRPLVVALWIIAEAAAMATDLAEIIGGAIGLSLLIHCSLLVGMAVTAALALFLLQLQNRGFRPMELAISGFVAAISVCYVVELFLAPVDWGAAVSGTFAPRLPDAGALALAVAIIGATLMPHAVFLHSALTQDRASPSSERERRQLIDYSNGEIVFALGVAGLVNMAMLIMAAAAFHEGHADVGEIETAYHTLTPLMGASAASVFLVSLLASGLSSSVVGTMAGQTVMQGFLGFRVPLVARRLITMIPAFVVVAAGVDATKALVYSQIALSLALPAPLIPLILFTRDRAIMGVFANGRLLHGTAIAAGAVVIGLNGLLLLQSAGVAIPGLAD